MRTGLTDRKNIMTGMGSGNVANQKMAGALNPEKSAALASESVTKSQMEDIEYKMSQIQEGFSEGFPKTEVTKENLETVYRELEKWRESQIDKEIQEENEGMYPSITPDDPLYNPMTDLNRRVSIEKDLDDIDFDDMIFKGYADQTIKIRNGFTITFRTLTTQQSLWIEKEMASLSTETVQYGRHFLSLKQLAVSLQSINGKTVGENISQYTKTSDRDDFESALKGRLEFINNLPQIITDDLIVQYVWFTGRVRKCLSGDVGKKLGN